MSYPDDRQYTADHEWILVEGEHGRVGVTAYATAALGDVVYVDLPELGSTVTAGQPCGEIESTKSVSDLVAPAGGEVVEVNQDVVDNPETVNADPHGAGWLYRVRVSATAPGLLDAAAYEALTTDDA